MKDLKNFDLNSFTFKYLKNKKMLFDNTLNGAMNLVNLTTEKDFYVDENNIFFNANGNFLYHFKKGNFKIKVNMLDIEDDEVNLVFYLFENNKIVKRLKARTKNRIALFCNLKFYFKKLNYNMDSFEFEISVNDDYNLFFNYVIEKENYEDLDTTVIEDNMNVYNILNKTEANVSQNNKKEMVTINPENGNLYISNYIVSDSSRVSILDRDIKLVKEDRLLVQFGA